MSLLRNFAVISLITVLAACGLKPVHQQNRSGSQAALNISVATIEGSRVGQIMQTEIEDSLNPTGQAVNAKYQLRVSLDSNREASVIDVDRSVDRYLMVVSAQFSLIELSTGKVVYSGSESLSDSFAAQDSDFATYTAERDAARRVAKEIGQIIASKVAGFAAGQQS